MTDLLTRIEFWGLIMIAVAIAGGVGFILGADYADWKLGRPRSTNTSGTER